MTRPDTLCPKHDRQSRTPDGIPKPLAGGDCKACDKLSALADLRALLPPGSTVYTILRSVSRSGMSRTLSVCISEPNEKDRIEYRAIRDLTHLAGKVLGLTRKDGWHYNAVKVDGCGMDMGFHVVYALASALYPDGVPCTGEKCNSNDHSNGDRDYTPGPQHMHRDGGYTLNHRWL